jgi:hypothetical protein
MSDNNNQNNNQKKTVKVENEVNKNLQAQIDQLKAEKEVLSQDIRNNHVLGEYDYQIALLEDQLA